jgi:hypothetical protein
MAAQLPDIIIIQGEQMDLYSNPLEQYWSLYKKKRPAFQSSSSCKRGYIATWEILDKQLLFRSIDGNVEKRSFLFWKKIVRCSMKMLFSKAGNKPVIAKWFTGKIRIPQGNRTLYVHNEYDSRFEREMVITIENGSVIKTVVLDYTQQKLQVEG